MFEAYEAATKGQKIEVRNYTNVAKGNPLQEDVHIDRALTNISIAYMQDQANFVADRVFPVVGVQKQSDVYFSYPRGEFNRDEMALRAPSTESAGGEYTIEQAGPYFCPVYAYHYDVPDGLKANADAPINIDREATQYLTYKTLLHREAKWVSNFFGTSIWGTDLTGVSGITADTTKFTYWDDDASEPIKLIEQLRITMLEDTGFEPNTLVLGAWVWSALKNHPSILSLINAGQTPGGPAKITLNMVKELFEIPNIYIMKAIQNTAKRGQTASHSFIAGRNALLCYSAPSPGLMTPSAGYTFKWTNGPALSTIATYRMDLKKAERMEIESSFDQKVIATDLGVFLDGAVSTPGSGPVS